jgi:hypothetical protein
MTPTDFIKDQGTEKAAKAQQGCRAIDEKCSVIFNM